MLVENEYENEHDTSSFVKGAFLVGASLIITWIAFAIHGLLTT